MKKGQVTVFVIVGVVILLIIGIVFFYKLVYQKEKQEIQERKLIGVPSQFLPVETVIEGCFKDTAEQAVKHVVLRGGYFDPRPAMSVIFDDEIEYEFPHVAELGEEEDKEAGIINPENSFVDQLGSNKVDVGYWYYNGQDRVPPISFIESQISYTIKETAGLCLVNLIDFGDFNFIQANETKVEPITNIIEKNVLVKFHYPLKVQNKGVTYIVKDKEVTVPLNVNGLYTAAKGMVGKIKEKPDFIPLSYFATLNYNISVYPFNNDVAYGLTDGKTTLLFANKFA